MCLIVWLSYIWWNLLEPFISLIIIINLACKAQVFGSFFPFPQQPKETRVVSIHIELNYSSKGSPVGTTSVFVSCSRIWIEFNSPIAVSNTSIRFLKMQVAVCSLSKHDCWLRVHFNCICEVFDSFFIVLFTQCHHSSTLLFHPCLFILFSHHFVRIPHILRWIIVRF